MVANKNARIDNRTCCHLIKRSPFPFQLVPQQLEFRLIRAAGFDIGTRLAIEIQGLR